VENEGLKSLRSFELIADRLAKKSREAKEGQLEIENEGSNSLESITDREEK